jgi:hypothetical protein
VEIFGGNFSANEYSEPDFPHVSSVENVTATAKVQNPSRGETFPPSSERMGGSGVPAFAYSNSSLAAPFKVPAKYFLPPLPPR